MQVFDIYSRRKRRAEQGEPDVYHYDHVPDQLRWQVVYILEEALGPCLPSSYDSNHQVWIAIRDTLLREKGLGSLTDGRRVNDQRQECFDAILNLGNVDDWLDVVEVCFVYAEQTSTRGSRGVTLAPKKAIEELNIRFRQAGFGYQFEVGQIMRVDSQLIHSEVIKPALVLLNDPRFAGAQDEFLSAHAHYRAGENEDAIVDANRAFESTMKAICEIGEWDYPKGARASDLVKVVRTKGLLPDYLDLSFDQLIATLKSGLPRVRDEVGGHGQGAAPRETPGYIAGYALHLAAANIVLLVEALKATETTSKP